MKFWFKRLKSNTRGLNLNLVQEIFNIRAWDNLGLQWRALGRKGW